jgi:hypothetical protein
MTSPALRRFEGRIAGLGTASGTRLVVGVWNRSPLGAFGDVMVETADGERVLFAPRDDIAETISALYTFDRTVVAPLHLVGRGRTLRMTGRGLELEFEVGRVAPLGLLLRLVPRPVAASWRWAAVIDPVARLVVPGAHTVGSAGGGYREYYGVTDARRIVRSSGVVEGRDLGGLSSLRPPVRFGFASMPAAPTLVDVVTTVR